MLSHWTRFERALAVERDGLLRASPRGRLASQRGRLQAAYRALQSGISRDRERRRARWLSLSGRLDGLSPLAVLGRGYALVRRVRDQRIVRAPTDVDRGENLSVRLGEGGLIVSVVDRERPDE